MIQAKQKLVEMLPILTIDQKIEIYESVIGLLSSAEQKPQPSEQQSSSQPR